MTRTVMVVDDVPFVRKTLIEILQQAHFQVVAEAADGHEACETFKRFRPDIVTMDIVMPKMGGLEATKRIMTMAPDAKVVVISAMGQESLVMEAINLGARDYILKPFTANDIRRTLDRVIRSEEKIANRSRI